MRILVVDNNIDAAEMLAELLRVGGHDVWTADGFAVLARLHDVRPDVAIVELQLFPIDGFTLAAKVRADTRLHGTPLIALTVLDADVFHVRANDAGYTHYLVKPQASAVLLKLIEGFTPRSPM